MRTEYQIWSRTNPNACYKVIRQAPTVDAAKATLALPDDEWRETPGGNIVPVTGLATVDLFISPVQVPESDPDRIQLAIELAMEYGSFDGDHHKMWCIDQMVRVLAGDRYEALITEYRNGDDGPDTYSWDEGIAP